MWCKKGEQTITTYNKIKDKIKPLTKEEIEILETESLQNTFRNINYYRETIFRLLKTLETT